MSEQDDPTGVSRLLAGLRETGPMPEDLVQRIRTSIDEEQVAREDTSEPADADRSPFWAGLEDAEEPHERPSRSRRRIGRWVLAGAAGLVAVAAGGSLVAGELGGADDATPRASKAGGAPSSTAGGQSARSEAAFTITRTGTAYTEEDFGQQATPLLEGPASVDQEPDEQLIGTMGTAAGAKDCLTRLGMPEFLPVAVDIATFDGQDGVAIVGQVPPDGEAQAVAVTPGCEPIWSGSTEVSTG